MTWFEAALAKYGYVWIGLSFGFAAKYALLLKRGVRIRAVMVIGDILLLPLVALIAYSLVHQFGVEDEAAALLTALATVSADRLVKLLTERFFRQVESHVSDVSARVRGEVRQEVQTEISAARIIDDTVSGAAPADYAALRPRPDKEDV